MNDPTKNADLIEERWNKEYRQGRYDGEPPVPFVREILRTLQADSNLWSGTGLYVGCGNGRNYLPLIDAGAKLQGLDISEEAIRRLVIRRPGRRLPVTAGDFRRYADGAAFAYLVAIQVFQHGGDDDAERYFANVATALKPGGIFFLRVNSAATEVYHRHTVVERNELGGFTIRYEEGPKQGLLVHFYSRDELLSRTSAAFELVMDPREDIIRRAPPKSGTWAQWEAIWRRRQG